MADRAAGRSTKGPKSAGLTPVAASPKAAKRKLTFNEKHALETLPGRMDALKSDLRKLKATLDDPQLYARDPERSAKVSAVFTKTETALAAAENEWLELEIMREEIGG